MSLNNFMNKKFMKALSFLPFNIANFRIFLCFSILTILSNILGCLYTLSQLETHIFPHAVVSNT